MCMNQRVVSLSTRTLYRAPPPLPALNGPKFSDSEKCGGTKIGCHQNSFGIRRVIEALLGKNKISFKNT